MRRSHLGEGTYAPALEAQETSTIPANRTPGVQPVASLFTNSLISV
jgi:hypothetical protein